ncbi:hypothetical protein E4K67_08990 [Desulfosporosinus fructosivorans]|uniref:Uncharacterized protein n=1 Tax=Desulfosporosinus fructosivorans TaxID=2018669 RepID=A0A4Z0R4T8_9FIRM|nr:hypothetical protein E4K67_08990 [Desulfosporosinus fructosivorans]
MRLIVRQGIKLNYRRWIVSGNEVAGAKWLTKKVINNCSTLGRSPVASKFLTFLAMDIQLVLHGD